MLVYQRVLYFHCLFLLTIWASIQLNFNRRTKIRASIQVPRCSTVPSRRFRTSCRWCRTWRWLCPSFRSCQTWSSTSWRRWDNGEHLGIQKRGTDISGWNPPLCIIEWYWMIWRDGSFWPRPRAHTRSFRLRTLGPEGPIFLEARIRGKMVRSYTTEMLWVYIHAYIQCIYGT